MESNSKDAKVPSAAMQAINAKLEMMILKAVFMALF